jgi:hypothetical protein
MRIPIIRYNYLLTYDSYGPVHNRFHRGECITWASGGEGALDSPGPLNGIERSECHLGPGVSPTGPSNAFAPRKSIMHRTIRISGQEVVLCKCKWGESRAHTVVWGPYCCVVLWWRFQLVGAGLWGGGEIWPPAHITLLVSVPSGLLWCKQLLSLSLLLFLRRPLFTPPPPHSFNRS